DEPAKADTECRFAEQRGPEPDEPSDHRRMIEERQNGFFRPGPIVCFIKPQIERRRKHAARHGEAEHKPDRHDQRPSSPRPMQRRWSRQDRFGNRCMLHSRSYKGVAVRHKASAAASRRLRSIACVATIAAMSVYALQKLIRDVNRKPACREAFFQSAETFSEGY